MPLIEIHLLEGRSAEQKKKFDELKGEPFEIPEGSFGRGGDGGRRRGEGERGEGGRRRTQRPAADN